MESNRIKKKMKRSLKSLFYGGIYEYEQWYDTGPKQPADAGPAASVCRTTRETREEVC